MIGSRHHDLPRADDLPRQEVARRDACPVDRARPRGSASARRSLRAGAPPEDRAAPRRSRPSSARGCCRTRSRLMGSAFVVRPERRPDLEQAGSCARSSSPASIAASIGASRSAHQSLLLLGRSRTRRAPEATSTTPHTRSGGDEGVVDGRCHHPSSTRRSRSGSPPRPRGAPRGPGRASTRRPARAGSSLRTRERRSGARGSPVRERAELPVPRAHVPQPGVDERRPWDRPRRSRSSRCAPSGRSSVDIARA